MAAPASTKDNFNVLDVSMEKLDLEMASLASSRDNISNLNDGDDDFWGEDEALMDIADNREWKRRQEQFHTMGYREGITKGKESSAQEGFNIGFKQSAGNGYNWGLVRGVSSAYANLPEHLKEKLPKTADERARLEDLYEAARIISTTDALKMFHESIQRSESDSPLDNHYMELVSLMHEYPEFNEKIGPAQQSSV